MSPRIYIVMNVASGVALKSANNDMGLGPGQNGVANHVVTPSLSTDQPIDPW